MRNAVPGPTWRTPPKETKNAGEMKGRRKKRRFDGPWNGSSGDSIPSDLYKNIRTIKNIRRIFDQIGTKFRASFVISMDRAGSVTVPIIALMASMFSTTTSASWWMAWKR